MSAVPLTTDYCNQTFIYGNVKTHRYGNYKVEDRNRAQFLVNIILVK